MPFLTKEELHTVAPLDFINILKGTDDSVVNDITAESISVFSTYLGSYYDVKVRSPRRLFLTVSASTLYFLQSSDIIR